jgi:hypothetical protein
MHEQQNQSNIREHERRDVLVEARIMDGTVWHDCRIINISVGGAKLSIGCEFRQGSMVRLQIASFGEFSGIVSWQRSEEVGVKFTHDPAELADVVMGLAMYG